MNGRKRRVHFVGIGGIGMSGIAEVLLTLGYAVSGSDLAESDTTRRLARLGARRSHVGPHDAAHVDARHRRARHLLGGHLREPRGRARARAQDPGHPARRDARRADAHEVRRRGRRHARQDDHDVARRHRPARGRAATRPWSSAASSATLGTNARLGQGEFLVAEADESDGTFLLLSPIVAVVTNIDREHLDYYGDMEQVRDGVPPVHPPRAVLRPRRALPRQRQRARAPAARPQALRHLRHRRPTPTGRRASSRVDGLETAFEVWRGGERLGHGAAPHARAPQRAERARRARGGRRARHPVRASRRTRSRSSAASTAASRCRARSATSSWSTTTATIPRRSAPRSRAAREGFTRRLVVAFQPHRYTRTRDLFDEFLGAFDDADVLLLTDDLRRRRGAHRGRVGRGALSRRSSAAATSTCASSPARERLADALLERRAARRPRAHARRRRHPPDRRRAPRAAARRRARAADPLSMMARAPPARARRDAARGARAARAPGASRSRATPRSASAARPTCWSCPTRRTSWPVVLARRRAHGVRGHAPRRRLERAGRRRRHPRRRREARTRLPRGSSGADGGRRRVRAGAAVQLGRLARAARGARARRPRVRRGHPGHGRRRALHERRRLRRRRRRRRRRGRGRRRRTASRRRSAREALALPLPARRAAARASS